MVSDTIEISKYLCQRFHKDKIYLMGHSAGTITGIMAAEKAPWLYKAYIGMGQIVDTKQSESLANQYMVNYYTKKNDKHKVKKLQQTYGTKKYAEIRDSYMHEAGIGTTRKMHSVITGIFFPVMEDSSYTIREKVNIWRGKALGGKSRAEKEKLQINLLKQVLKLEIPTYFFSGAYDYTVNYQMSEAYFKEIQAPIKGFYLFEKSAHSPIFEEPEKTFQILSQDVIKGENDLAQIK